MAFTQAHLDALDAAIASGELEVKIGEKQVKYRNVAELMQARSFIAQQIANAGGTVASSADCIAVSFGRE